MKPVPVNFQVCAADVSIVREYLTSEDAEHFDQDVESYIEITLDDSGIYTSNNIKDQIVAKILKPFKKSTCEIGKSVDYSEILNDIYSITGVSRVRTVFIPNEAHKAYASKHVDGLSFATWTDSGVLIGMEDADVGNTTRVMQEFQYPVYIDQSALEDHIKIIRKSLSNINTLKV